MKTTTIIVIGILPYIVYNQYNKRENKVIDSKDLYKVKDVPHSKNVNPVYDPSTNDFIKIQHHFTNQIETRNYASM